MYLDHLEEHDQIEKKEQIEERYQIEEKEKIFNSIRRKWISVGKVPSHQSFNLNNSYKHQIKLYYDLVYLNHDFKEKNLK